MIHNVIVPGIGGSEESHWQSWLQRQLMSCSRVEQQHWQQPVLQQWITQFVQSIVPIQTDLQIIAHSFGCLTTVAALAQHPQLNQKVKHLILVAPANPRRFAENDFADDQQLNLDDYFQQLDLAVPTTLLMSENDPWLNPQDGKRLAQAWQLEPINLGQVGHVNTASGFGPFPEILPYLISK